VAATSTPGLCFPACVQAIPTTPIRSNRRRRITPQAGHALEKLGHAIEYLADEFVHEGGDFSARDGRLQAVQMLMALNRQVYFECPEAPTFGERLRGLLGLRSA
jgi:hypothetical protein